VGESGERQTKPSNTSNPPETATPTTKASRPAVWEARANRPVGIWKNE